MTRARRCWSDLVGDLTVRRSVTIAICIYAVILAGCNKRNNKPENPGSSGSGAILHTTANGTPALFYTPPDSAFDVTYTSNTVRMDLPTFRRTLHSASRDGQVLVFDSSAQQLQSLSSGKVLLIEHVGVRRILAVQKQGSEIAIATQTAALTDFIQDGRIEFSAPLNARRQQANSNIPRNAAQWSLWSSWLAGPSIVYADEACGNPAESRSGLALKGEVDEWEFEVEGEPEGDDAVFCLTAQKNLKALSASVKMKGEIKNVKGVFKAVIHGGQTQDFEYSTPISGHLHLGWAALTSNSGASIGESRIKFPPFMKQIIDVDGLPFLLQASGGLIFTPGFGGKKDAGEGGFDINYDGSGGFSVHGGQNTQPEGQVSSDVQLEKTTTESLAPHGVVVAIAAPKVSISVGTDSFAEAIKEIAPPGLLDTAAEELEGSVFKNLFNNVKKNFFDIEAGAFVQIVTSFDYTGSGPMSVVPCTLSHVSIYGQAGADATLLALKAGSPHVEFLKKTKTNRNPDIPACGQK